MARKQLIRLVAGFRRFREKYFDPDSSVYKRLSQGQSPKTLVIACSDSRVDPAIISDAGPGELFVVRNVANLVPPFETGGGLHGVSAAIEFAVMSLKVEHIIVLGHRQCGGIRALMTTRNGATPESFIDRWMGIAVAARDRVLAKFEGADFETQCTHCEQESIKISLENLRTFPFVRDAIRDRGMNLIGTYFDLESGQILEYLADSDQFQPVL